MSAIANIVVPDATSPTPVNKTYIPQKVEGNTARWQEKTAASPAGYLNLSATLRDPVPGSDVYRFQLALAMPKLKTYTDLSGNSITTVEYISRANVEILLPNLGLLQERKDLLKMLRGILADAQIVDQVENLNHAY